MIGEIRQNFTEASASVGLILATALVRAQRNINWSCSRDTEMTRRRIVVKEQRSLSPSKRLYSRPPNLLNGIFGLSFGDS